MPKIRVACAIRTLICLSIAVIGCTPVPDSDFYETEGILSIFAENLDVSDDWALSQSGSLYYRKVSHGPSSAFNLHFPFYLQNPGDYEIWFLVKNSEPESIEPAELRIEVTDREGTQHHYSTVLLTNENLFHWISPVRDGNTEPVRFSDSGFYSVNVSTSPGHKLFIHKLQMMYDPENRPSGLGLPETNRPNMDPVLEKREERVSMPPAWSFGVMEGGTENKSDEINERTQKIIAELTPGSVIRELPHLADIGQYEGTGLRQHIEMAANPLLVTYELPFAFYQNDLLIPELFTGMSDELKIRWLQFQTLNSIMKVFEPELLNHADSASESGRILIQQFEELTSFRKKLFPYIYSLSHLAVTSGERPVRGDSNDPTQFRLGEAFLVAPVYEEGVEEKFVYLPEGIWIDELTGRLYEGGQSWLIETPITKIPLFRRVGSIVPYRMDISDLLRGYSHRLIIDIVAGAPGTFRLYEDDGVTTNYRRGEYSTTAFRYFEHDDHATFTIGRMVGGFTGQPSEKELKLKFKYIRGPVSVLANETVLEEGAGLNQWHYNEDKEELILNWIQPNEIKTDFIIRF